jgi:sugar lactone lactonase YvrE
MLKLKLFMVSLLWVFIFNNQSWANQSSPVFTLAWTLNKGLNQPESVIYDNKRNRLYVSNVQGKPTRKDGKGYLSIVSLEGKLIKSPWFKELNAPKGMAIVGDNLYVSDIDVLVAINIDKGKAVARYEINTTKFLNDVTADKQGNIYVSDMSTNSIYCLCNGQFKLWLQDAELMNPNGLLAEDHRLVISSWGIITEGWNTSTAGHVKTVRYTDKKLTSLGDGKPIGNLDGIESDGSKGYYVTDWMVGKLFHIDAKGRVKEIMQLQPSSADHAYLAEKNLLLIPMMNDNQLKAFKKN